MPIGCRFSPDGGGPDAMCGLASPNDDDVSGHAFVPTHNATITMTWSKDEDSNERVDFTSDDPEAEKLLLAMLNRTPLEASQAAAS